MSEHIEKIKKEEQVRFLVLKHKGQLARVAEEAQVDLEYVKTVANDLKTKRDKDVATNVAAMLSMEIIEGHEARVAHLQDALHRLQLRSAKQQSLCCDAPVRTFTWGITEGQPLGDYELRFICTKCQQECPVNMKELDLAEYRRLLQLWLTEDRTLGEFAERMGLTFKETQPPIINQSYQVAIISGQPVTNQDGPPRKVIDSQPLDPESQTVLKEAETLTPTMRELLRKNLELKMLEDETGQK